MNLKRGQRIELEWEDIQDYADDDWNEDPDYYDTASLRSILYVAFDFNDGSRVLRVSKDWAVDDDTPRGVRCVPPGCVTSVRSCITGEELWDLPHRDDRTLQSGTILREGEDPAESFTYQATWPPERIEAARGHLDHGGRT